MKSSIFALFLLLNCIAVFASNENAPSETIPAIETVSTCTDYTPYQEDKAGQRIFNGRNIETLYRVVEGLSMRLDTSIRAPFVRCMKLLEQHKIDVMAGLISTEQRAKLFSLVPYRQKAPLAIFYLKDEYPQFDIKWLGKTEVIGIHRAFALPDNIKSSELASQLTPITSVGVGFEMLAKQRLSGVLATTVTGSLILADWPEMHSRVSYQLLPSQDEAVYFAIHPESPLALRKSEILQILEQLAQAPEYQHLDL